MKLKRNSRETKYGSGERKKRNGTRGMNNECNCTLDIRSFAKSFREFPITTSRPPASTLFYFIFFFNSVVTLYSIREKRKAETAGLSTCNFGCFILRRSLSRFSFSLGVPLRIAHFFAAGPLSLVFPTRPGSFYIWQGVTSGQISLAGDPSCDILRSTICILWVETSRDSSWIR